MHERTINDEEIRQCFHSYTQLMLDLTMNLSSNGTPLDINCLMHNGQPLNKLFLPRTKRLRQTNMFRAYRNMEAVMRNDIHNDIAFGKIAGHLHFLRLRGWPDSQVDTRELLKILEDIDKFLVDETSVERLLFLMP